MSPEVRKLTPGDVDAFNALRLESVKRHPAAYSMDEAVLSAATREQALSLFQEPADVHGFVLGAFSGELIGITGSTLISRRKGRHIATVWGFYVQQAFRGQGVGDALLARLLETSLSLEHVEQVRLMVPVDHLQAVALFRRHGFSEYGCERRGRKTDDGYHDLLYLQTDPS